MSNIATVKTNMTPSAERVAHVDAVEVLHTDGTVNLVDPHAATAAELPASSLPALFVGITLGKFSVVLDITPAVIAATTRAVMNAYVTTFHYIFYATIPFSALLIVSCCFIPNMDEHLHGNVAKRLQCMGNVDGKEKAEHARTV